MPTINSSGSLASSTRREDRRGDTGDCPAQTERRRSAPGSVSVTVANGYCRNHQNNSQNKTTPGKSKANKSGQGFYSISDNLGFKLNGDCDSLKENNSGNFPNCDHSGDLDTKENDSFLDLNKCDPSCYDSYYKRNNAFDEEESDAEDDGDFALRSNVKGLGPAASLNSIGGLNTSPRNVRSSTPIDDYYPPSLKTRSSSYPNTILNPNRQQQQTAQISSFNLTLNLPQREETITQGFGVKMVATASCQQLMYRSVPPRPLSYTLTDVLEPKGPTQRSKTAPVSVNSPDDYVQRFKSRPTTRPRVIEFDGSTVSSKTKKMAMVSQGFPTSRAKIYIGHTKAMSPTQQSQTARTPSSRLHLAPLDHSGRRSTSGFTAGSSRTTKTVDKSQGKGGGSLHGNQATGTRTAVKSAGSTIPDQGAKSIASFKPSTSHETIQSAEFSMSVPRAPTPDSEDHIHNPELLLTSNSDCDDLSVLPRPKKVLPKRELPWVFRYKVKKGMNTLSRIMASKPSQNNALQTNYSLT